MFSSAVICGAKISRKVETAGGKVGGVLIKVLYEEARRLIFTF